MVINISLPIDNDYHECLLKDLKFPKERKKILACLIASKATFFFFFFSVASKATWESPSKIAYISPKFIASSTKSRTTSVSTQRVLLYTSAAIDTWRILPPEVRYPAVCCHKSTIRGIKIKFKLTSSRRGSPG